VWKPAVSSRGANQFDVFEVGQGSALQYLTQP
jgi:hypothetical protein